MKNCLLTRFNSNSVNPDLPTFGVVEALLNQSRSNINAIFGNWRRFKAKVSAEDGYFVKEGTPDVHYQEIYVDSGNVSFVKNTTGKAAKVLYDVTSEGTGQLIGSMNLDNLQGSEIVRAIFLTQGYIENDESKGSITCTGSINDIGWKYPILQVFRASYMSITGDIKTFGNCISLVSLDFVYCPNITGSLEEMADGIFALGRRDPNYPLTVTCNGVITCNGVAVPNGTTKTITFSSSGYVIS